MAACPDGYFASATTFGYCGAKTLKAAVLGLAKSFAKNAEASQKAAGLNETLGSMQVGLFRHANSTLFCYWVGGTAQGQITARAERFGTGQAYCSEYDETDVVDGKNICNRNGTCIPWVQKEFSGSRPTPTNLSAD